MKQQITIYSKVTQTKDMGEYDDIVDVVGSYILLEYVDKEWYGDKNRGLATYLDNTELGKYVSKILYYYEQGYIHFNIIFFNNCDISKKIPFRGKEMPIIEAACNYISGQISDGWGENGILLYNPRTSEVIRANCSYQLYEEDYEASDKLAEEKGIKFSLFEDFPVYKKLEFK